MVGFMWYMTALLAVSGSGGNVAAAQYLLGLGALLSLFVYLFNA